MQQREFTRPPPAHGTAPPGQITPGPHSLPCRGEPVGQFPRGPPPAGPQGHPHGVPPPGMRGPPPPGAWMPPFQGPGGPRGPPTSGPPVLGPRPPTGPGFRGPPGFPAFPQQDYHQGPPPGPMPPPSAVHGESTQMFRPPPVWSGPPTWSANTRPPFGEPQRGSPSMQHPPAGPPAGPPASDSTVPRYTSYSGCSTKHDGSWRREREDESRRRDMDVGRHRDRSKSDVWDGRSASSKDPGYKNTSSTRSRSPSSRRKPHDGSKPSRSDARGEYTRPSSYDRGSHQHRSRERSRDDRGNDRVVRERDRMRASHDRDRGTGSHCEMPASSSKSPLPGRERDKPENERWSSDHWRGRSRASDVASSQGTEKTTRGCRSKSRDRHGNRSPLHHGDRSVSRHRDRFHSSHRTRSPSHHRDRSSSQRRDESDEASRRDTLREASVTSTDSKLSQMDADTSLDTVTMGEERNTEEQEDVLATEVDVDEPPIPAWTRCCPADVYFIRDRTNGDMTTTARMQALESKMETELVDRASRERGSRPLVPHTAAHRLPLNLIHYHLHKGGCCGGGHSDKSGSSDKDNSSSSSDNDSENEEYSEEVRKSWMEAISRKKLHPERLHDDLWFNEPDEMNDGPICRCSKKNRQTGIRHCIYPGEEVIPECLPNSNNASRLHHYQITMSPHTNFLTKNPTVITHDDHEYIFEGFSLFSHHKIDKVPVCKVIRFNIEYTIHWLETDMPENVSVGSMNLFSRFLYSEILELVDLDWITPSQGCPRYHIMPRFARALQDNGKELLSMNVVLQYLLTSNQPLINPTQLPDLMSAEQKDWQRFVDKVRGTIVTYPGKRPSSIRIDQLDRENIPEGTFPKIVHFGIKPAQLSYAGDAAYQRLWKQYMKLKHLLANKPKVTSSDKSKLKAHEDKLQDLRLKDTMKREMTVEIDSEGFIRTGIHSDMTQHGLLVPVLISHLRFHQCLYQLQEHIKYTFKDPILLQLALTHPSYRIKFGTNPDHARNSLTNCGMRQLEYGDRRIHYKHTRKRGINTLFYIMSKLGRGKESLSEISHYERLEFLGDAIVEFLSSIHLFYMFPSLEEGGLTMYRTALVQNQHLTVLAGKLKLQHFMLYAHGPDLCRDSDLRHAMANCFEALIGALFLDGGIDVADRVLSEALFSDDPELFHIWANYPKHPLQMDELDGDRHWITSSAPLQKLVEFEESIGVNFTHIRLLAKAFSMRNVGYNNLTMGHNQRLEFLGDTVLQLITSEYLFKHFPDHHEGHLSLLRSSLVNNRTQAVICTDLDMLKYVIYADRVWKQPADIDSKFKYKDRADLVEALLGALYVDKGLDYCTVFCQVCFYPRLKEFIMNQDWNDPKSQLQQCCLTLRGLDEADPNIPVYKVLESTGPTNTRKYVVGVYFKGRRLATGTGHSIQEAQMLAAGNALKNKARLFPLVKQQKCFLDRKFHKHRREDGQSGRGSEMDDSLPAGYRQHNNDDLDTDSHSGSFKRSRTSHLSRFSSSQPRPPRSRLHVPSPGYQTPRETSNLPPQD